MLAVVCYFGGAGLHFNQGWWWWWFDVLVVPLEGFAPYSRHNITTKMLNKWGVLFQQYYLILTRSKAEELSKLHNDKEVILTQHTNIYLEQKF